VEQQEDFEALPQAEAVGWELLQEGQVHEQGEQAVHEQREVDKEAVLAVQELLLVEMELLREVRAD
jgi:hypothetical protein